MSYGLQTVGLRYFNVFGRRQDPSGAYAAVIPRWIASLLRGERCRIFGDGETTRDFCFVSNVVQANLLAATVNDNNATCQAYNIACGESVSLNDLFRTMRDGLAKFDGSVRLAAPQYDEFRAGDIRFSCASIDKARDQLAYSPTHGVAEGLVEALEWYVAKTRATADKTRLAKRHSHLAAGTLDSASLPLVQARP
jgi:UDP-N-acetylglucosamine 4-epimerase